MSFERDLKYCRALEFLQTPGNSRVPLVPARYTQTELLEVLRRIQNSVGVWSAGTQ